MFKNKAVRFKQYSVGIFIKDEIGAILWPFIIFLPLFIGLLYLSFEISHYLQKAAKLSDAIEQATLALTIENNTNNPDETQTEKNISLVNAYARAYLPSESFSAPVIDIISHPNYIEYRAATTLNYTPKFLTKELITNIDRRIIVSDNGVAIKNKFTSPGEITDVVFVVDYSVSMDGNFGDEKKTTKIQELRRIFEDLNNTILKNNNTHTIGFVPFSWGTKKIIGKGIHRKIYCHFPFVPKTPMPPSYYLGDLKSYNPAKELTDAVKNNIDYDETIKSITANYNFINIPIDDIKPSSFCLKGSDAYTLRSDDITNDNIQENIEHEVNGLTLISSGILVANDIFRKDSKNKDKLMIIISDGNDQEISSDLTQEKITKTLIEKGMCERIKENNIRMVFIGIAYTVKEIKWEDCVGKRNYYEAQNAHELEADLRQALGTIEASEVGRNIPKN
ncbi:tight adherance operon protein [Yersinia aldovae ATCC 35236]|uniref:Putative tight adherance operon protein n=1 Tax=Yersinia aldovae TaxID=29483 RepID=A0A0T9TKD3_YERAL|nr:TadE/TadG family type IV pilus assembly protein [Yersinia aldovae]EEP95224.1 tight adherance operon protein [Yersinia aldovae ATCC 35236]CNK87686.1 putative tight adherance operon protein [Yersinia aldovae]